MDIGDRGSKVPRAATEFGPPGRFSPSAELERWRDKHGIADHFACSVRWIESRMGEGMPYTMIAGRAKFRISEVEPWLELHGHIEHCGETVAA